MSSLYTLTDETDPLCADERNRSYLHNNNSILGIYYVFSYSTRFERFNDDGRAIVGVCEQCACICSRDENVMYIL